MDIREKLLSVIKTTPIVYLSGRIANAEECIVSHVLKSIADHLIAHGVTVQERNEEGCPYCDIAKANEGVVNTKLLVKEAETSKWTMMGKRLIFCPMCGRELPQPPKGE